MRDPQDRERLAEASLRKHAAVHKGRPHFHAHQKRARSKAKLDAARAAEKLRVASARKLKAKVRAYWRGEADNHP